MTLPRDKMWQHIDF